MGRDKTGNELEPFGKTQVFFNVKDTTKRCKVKKTLHQVGLKK
jgi:hypothetical protein